MYIYKENSYDRVINYDVMRSIDPPCNSHLPSLDDYKKTEELLVILDKRLLISSTI